VYFVLNHRNVGLQMCPNIEFKYNGQIWNPPAPALFVELRSPASPDNPLPEHIVALIDSGAFISVVPENVIIELQLHKIDEVEAGGYDATEEDFKVLPVYAIHLTIPHMKPILARVIPKKPKSHMTLGREVINEWLLTLDGPNLEGHLEK
jgi:hypothetical protein